MKHSHTLKDNGTTAKFHYWKRSLYDPGDGAYPKLSGTAAACRQFGKPLLDVFKLNCVKTGDKAVDTMHQQIVLVLQRSVKLEQIIEDHKLEYRWDTPVCEDFLETTFDYLALQKALSNYFVGQSPPIALFNVTIKSHMVLHCALYNFGINPCMVWNYQGEDFMGRVKKLVQQNTNGLQWKAVNGACIEQYIRGMDLILRDSFSHSDEA